MRISVIIPVFNGEAYLSKLFDSIVSQSASMTNVEFLFIDNNSNDNSMSLIKEFMQKNKLVNAKLFLFKEKQSSYASRNFGIKQSKGDYLCFTDADCILDNNYIKNLIEKIELYPNKIISGKVELFIHDKKNIWENFDKEVNMRNENKIESNSAATANLIVPAHYFSDAGLFMEITSGGDVEWTQRAIRYGKEMIYIPEIKVFHPCRNTFEETKKKMHRLGIGYGEKSKNKIQIILKSLFRIFYIPTNAKISKNIYKNVGLIGIIKFNILFFALRIYQLKGVIYGTNLPR